ncbi:MAG TPA: TadE/TadG family type IV pilus assembly protein [Rhizomicrobium sp.]
MWRSTAGVAGIEFAFIAPVLAILLVGTIEICSALACREKVISLAANVSDVIAMTSSVSATDISNVYNSGNAILYPFPVGTTAIVISSIKYSATTRLNTVAWSRAQNGTALTQGSVVTTVPAGVIATTDGASAILVTVTYPYKSPIGEFIVGTLNMGDSFYARPRQSLSVACNGC